MRDRRGTLCQHGQAKLRELVAAETALAWNGVGGGTHPGASKGRVRGRQSSRQDCTFAERPASWAWELGLRLTPIGGTRSRPLELVYRSKGWSDLPSTSPSTRSDRATRRDATSVPGELTELRGRVCPALLRRGTGSNSQLQVQARCCVCACVLRATCRPSECIWT